MLEELFSIEEHLAINWFQDLRRLKEKLTNLQ